MDFVKNSQAGVQRQINDAKEMVKSVQNELNMMATNFDEDLNKFLVPIAGEGLSVNQEKEIQGKLLLHIIFNKYTLKHLRNSLN